MSGGSFNYLYCKDVGDLTTTEAQNDLIKMRDELSNLGFTDVAQDTEDLRNIIARYDIELRRVNAEINKLLIQAKPVWRAVELYKSCDAGIDYVASEVDRFNKARVWK